MAEKDQTKWHAPGLFDKVTGEIYKKTFDTPQPPKYQDVFGKTIIELAQKNKNIFGITPAMPSGSSMKFMMEEMPDRAIDVGICEQHAVTVSAGMATQGLRVFCNIYSSFMQAYGIDLIDAQNSLHWKKFNALLNGLPSDTKFAEVLKIRSYKPQKGDSKKYKEGMKRLKKEYALPKDFDY